LLAGGVAWVGGAASGPVAVRSSGTLPLASDLSRDTLGSRGRAGADWVSGEPKSGRRRPKGTWLCERLGAGLGSGARPVA